MKQAAGMFAARIRSFLSCFRCACLMLIQPYLLPCVFCMSACSDTGLCGETSRSRWGLCCGPLCAALRCANQQRQYHMVCMVLSMTHPVGISVANQAYSISTDAVFFLLVSPNCFLVGCRACRVSAAGSSSTSRRQGPTGSHTCISHSTCPCCCCNVRQATRSRRGLSAGAGWGRSVGFSQ